MMNLFLWCEGFTPLSHSLCIELSNRARSADTELIVTQCLQAWQSYFKGRVSTLSEEDGSSVTKWCSKVYICLWKYCEGPFSIIFRVETTLNWLKPAPCCMVGFCSAHRPHMTTPTVAVPLNSKQAHTGFEKQ